MILPLGTGDLVALLAAIPLAALGGAAFLRGVLDVATWLRMPKFLVATVIAAFATSSPELTMSSLAALAGKPEIGLGDVLGGNVVNLGLILGIALLFGPLPAHFDEFKRDFALALGVPGLTALLMLDGTLSRADGILLLTLFALWLALVVRQGVAHRRAAATDAVQPVSPLHSWPFLLAGLAGLIMAGHLFVTGASGIALALGVHPFVIGATIAALGTSLPELVTVLLSRLHGHSDVALGTLLGSNLFNGLAIVGVTATIHPIQAPLAEVGVALACGIGVVLLILPRAGTLSRRRGAALLAVYATFAVVTAAIAT